MQSFRIHSISELHHIESHTYYVKYEHNLARKQTKTEEKRVCVFCWIKSNCNYVTHTHLLHAHVHTTDTEAHLFHWIHNRNIRILLAVSFWNAVFLLFLTPCAVSIFRQGIRWTLVLSNLFSHTCTANSNLHKLCMYCVSHRTSYCAYIGAEKWQYQRLIENSRRSFAFVNMVYIILFL